MGTAVVRIAGVGTAGVGRQVAALPPRLLPLARRRHDFPGLPPARSRQTSRVLPCRCRCAVVEQKIITGLMDAAEDQVSGWAW